MNFIVRTAPVPPTRNNSSLPPFLSLPASLSLHLFDAFSSLCSPSLLFHFTRELSLYFFPFPPRPDTLSSLSFLQDNVTPFSPHRIRFCLSSRPFTHVSFCFNYVNFFNFLNFFSLFFEVFSVCPFFSVFFLPHTRPTHTHTRLHTHTTHTAHTHTTYDKLS